MIEEHDKFYSRPKHIEKLIVDNMSSTKRLENFLSDDEIIQLLTIFKKGKKLNSTESAAQLVDDLINDDNIEQSKKLQTRPDLIINTTAALNWDKGTSEVLESKLRKVIPNFEVVGGKFYLNQGSFKLHTDSGADRNHPIYKIFTIPLKFDKNIDIYTPTFNQYWLGSATRFLRGSKDVIESKALQYVQDYEKVPLYNLTYKEFDKKDYNNLSHIDIENLWGFSLESMNKWKKGDIFVIDRAKIHASCDYGIKHKTSKIFMTIVTKLKDYE